MNALAIVEHVTAPLNRTELLQVCKRAGIFPTPGEDRQRIVQMLAREVPSPGESEDPINAWRNALIQFISDYWSQLAPGLTCPAKNLKHPMHPDPRPCFKCPDAQVVSCILRSDNEQRIKERLK